MTLANRVEGYDALVLSRDARLVAVRWDVVPWGIVLDLDTPDSEANGAAMRRAWLIFAGVSEVTIPMRNNRLPTGIWLSSPLAVEKEDHGFSNYTCSALLPTFDRNRLREADSGAEISIRAQSLVGAVSANSATPGEYGLSLRTRIELSSDEDLLVVLETILEGH